MATITTGKTYFEPKFTDKLFSNVKGKSTLAGLTASEPIPFSGTGFFTFSMEGEASIVGEGQKKPAGEASWGKVTVKPIKFIYQHRLTDEFTHMSEEQQIPYLDAFTDGFQKKMARALDIAAFHGLNPASKEASEIVGDNCFTTKVTQNVNFAEATPDENIDDAIAVLQQLEKDVTGMAITPAFGSALGKMKDKNGLAIYPQFRFGAVPALFGSMAVSQNTTLSFNDSKIKMILGDFANAFKWGYSQTATCEVIEYGNPDGLGDLKESNEIVLRSEAYMGWGIIDPSSFVKVVVTG